MADAEVGDDVLDGDPTVRRLEAIVAERLGHEAALFVPTGSMGNQVAIALHARAGSELLVDADAHIVHWEECATAALSGVQVRPVRGERSVMTADDLAAALRAPSRYAPRANLVALENTHNGAGGVVTTHDAMQALVRTARDAHLQVHLDGARLWNAHVASGTTLDAFARLADTVMVSFSKGLGAPVGAAVVGTRAAMDEAWHVRRRFGGGMRQSGILAAAALHGLTHHLERLAHDHAHAASLARAIDGAGGARVVPPDTNIVMVDLPGRVADAVVAAAAREGVRVSAWSPTRVRAVTHLDVSAHQIARAGHVLATALESAATTLATRP
ncbi:MAG: aminotransferase class I/II-fold pyridoxal phosphate-dependent enzyme [Gemmatimonadaceae bacterium]|nr:aminotransferase class I/II-fold pyridoxal phosphate-dependent enzyme [Gemmatimonadaceae bacterium]